jgi:hypothetical protein
MNFCDFLIAFAFRMFQVFELRKISSWVIIVNENRHRHVFLMWFEYSVMIMVKHNNCKPKSNTQTILAWRMRWTGHTRRPRCRGILEKWDVKLWTRLNWSMLASIDRRWWSFAFCNSRECLEVLRFSWQWLFRLWSSGLWHRVVLSMDTSVLDTFLLATFHASCLYNLTASLPWGTR